MRTVMHYGAGVLFLAVLVYSNQDFLATTAYLTASDHPLRNMGVFACITGIGLAGVVVPLFSRRWWVCLLWLLPLSVILAVSLSFTLSTGSPFSLLTARVLFQETTGWLNAVQFYGREVATAIGAGVIFLASGLLLYRGLSESKARGIVAIRGLIQRTVFAFLPVGVVVLYLAIPIVKSPESLKATVEPYRSLATLIYAKGADYLAAGQPRQPVTATASPSRRAHVIALVVDESLRFDYGFDGGAAVKNFLPPKVLEQGQFYAFQQAESAHNCSSFSNAALRWGVGKKGQLNRSGPTLWHYARRAGMHTVYIDAQRRFGQLQNFMTGQEVALIDEFIQFNAVPNIEKDKDFVRQDEKVAERISAFYHATQPTFIYANKMGFHFPYEGKYPATAALYRPHMGLYDGFRSVPLQTLRNSYKNAVTYNLTQFFDRLLPLPAKVDITIFYTADHGQNFEDRRNGTHCTGGKVTTSMTQVPLVIFSTNQAVLSALQALGPSGSQSAAHKQIMPTIVSLMGYDPQTGVGQTLFFK